MNVLIRLIALTVVLLAGAAIASPAEAGRIEKTWGLTVEKWNIEVRMAKTPEERAAAMANRPDATPFARRMWDQIGMSLDKDWTIEPAAWFLTVTPGLLASKSDGTTAPTFAAEIEAIRKAVETYHLKSANMTPMCVALISSQDPRSLALLEKIQEVNPDQKTQGVAALGAAIVLKSLGDNPDIIRKRLNYLRKAIIQSSSVEIGGSTVAEIAEDELYVIQHLTKGRVAPDLTGIDSAGRPLKLSDYQGKVIMLVFWSSNMPDAKHVVRMITDFAAKNRDQPFVVIGVNQDPLAVLRDLESDDTVSWTSFTDPNLTLSQAYRATSPAVIYVLDRERKIQYAGAPGSFAELTVDALLSGK